MPTEADTCRMYVVPGLHAAAWTDEQIAEQRTFPGPRDLWNRYRTVKGLPEALEDQLGEV